MEGTCSKGLENPLEQEVPISRQLLLETRINLSTVYTGHRIHTTRKLFTRKLRSMYSGFAIQPRSLPMLDYAVIINTTFLQELGRAHFAVIHGIEAIIREWSSNPSLASLIPLHPRLSRLLRDSSPPNHVSGILSPVFQITDTGTINVCELTTRMQFADVVSAATAQRNLFDEVQRIPHSNGLMPHDPCVSLLLDFKKRLDANNVRTIWVVHGDLPGPSFSTCDFLPGINIRTCHFKELFCQSSQSNVLCCRLDAGATERISFCILELHQHELLTLKDNVLDALKSLSNNRRTLSDLHTMLLASDNRVLYALRTNSIEVQDEIKSLLKKIISPTAPASGRTQQYALLAPSSLLIRPCVSGQGSYAREQAVGSDVFYRLIADLRNDDPFVVQPDVRSCNFDCVSSQGRVSKPMIGAVAPSLDGRFYGSCMLLDECGQFEASETSSQARVLSCVSDLSEFGPSFYSHITDVGNVREKIFEIKKALAFNGMNLVSASHKTEISAQRLLLDILHGEENGGYSEYEHGSAYLNGDILRHRFPNPVARNDFVPQTENSFDDEPTRFIAISFRGSWTGTDGYFLSFGNVGDAVKRMDTEAVHALRTLKVKWINPSKNCRDNVQPLLAPVLLSSSRARLCRDRICARNLSEKDQETFWASFNLLYDELKRDCEGNRITVYSPCVILIDNHRFVHICSDLFDNTVDVEKIPFQLEHRPEVMRALIAAHEHPLYQYHNTTYFPSAFDNGKDVTSLQNWPLLYKNRLVSSMAAVFRDLFFGKGDVYWSPSSGSTGSSAKAVALPTALSEMRVMRSMLREMYLDGTVIASDTVCVNLLPCGNLSRALEVQGEILVGACATHLPLGPDVPDEIVCDVIEYYGANMITALGSRLLQLAIFCEITGRRLPSITRLLHGGESLSELALQNLQRYWSADVQCFAIFGSSEAGIFALRRPNESTYSVLPDGVHCEIVDENDCQAETGQFGTLVVTVLPRIIHPLVRYYTEDVARFTSSARDRFELRGRNMRSVSRKVGSVIVSWDDVIHAIQPLLDKAFAGMYLYQLWLQEDDEHGIKSKTSVTLAIYGKVTDDWEDVSSRAAYSLQKVFSPKHNVSRVGSVLLDKSEDLHRIKGSRKLQYFTVIRPKSESH